MEIKELFGKLSNCDLSKIYFDFQSNSLHFHCWFSENETIVKFNKLINFEYRPDFSDEPPWVILKATYKLIDLSSLLLNEKALFLPGSRAYNELKFPVIVSEFKSGDVEIKIICQTIDVQIV